MCTLTYIPQKTGFVLTSNRDEHVFRPTLKPKIYTHQHQKLIYPKDEVANGSWIAISSKRKMACLLNGGFEKHKRKAIYAKSRGIILIESLEASSFQEFMKSTILNDIEPFTLLLFDFNENEKMQITQLVWDGIRKHIENIDVSIPQIWSSAPLYSSSERLIRAEWFSSWIHQFKDREDFDIHNFHRAKHTENSAQNILMKGECQLETVSISQVRIGKEESSFYYADLIDDSRTKLNLMNWFDNGE